MLTRRGFFRAIAAAVAVPVTAPLLAALPAVSSPAAISIPFGTLPSNLYIRGPRYRVMFDRITVPRFTKNAAELRTWSQIRI